MKKHRKTPIPKGRFAVYERLTRKIEEYSEQHGRSSNAEIIRRLRITMFGPEPEDLLPAGQTNGATP
jgi:hypothetical protein